MGEVNSKKLCELSVWERIDEVDTMLDAGEKPKTVHKWITSNGFQISHPLVYEYARQRRLNAMDKILAGQYITPVKIEAMQDMKRVPIIDNRPGAMAVKRLRNELDALEAIIQLGYNSLLNLPVGAITPKLMMEAIDLKNKITEGAYGHHTEFGLNRLKELENRKIKAIGKVLFTFVPEDKREEAVAAIETFEDDFYMDTNYYADYLNAKEQG